MTGFADSYALDDFRTVAVLAWWRSEAFSRVAGVHAADHPRNAAMLAARRADAADQAALKLHEAGAWRNAVRSFLEAARGAGRLGATGGMGGRKIWQALAWNGFVAGADFDEERWLGSLFDRVLTWTIVCVDRDRRHDGRDPWEHRIPSDAMVEAAWKGLCATMDAGDSDMLGALHNVECQDSASGERCELAFRDWKATLLRRNARHELEVAPDLAEVPLTAVGIDLPTGDLLMTDYLRAGETSEDERDTPFTKAIDLGAGEYARFDIGSTLGRARRSEAHAERHAMGFVQTTNTSVVVHRHPASGVIMASERYRSDEAMDDDGDAVCEGWEKLGSFSCDMWRITALDRSSAVALMDRGGDPDAAATLDAYLASDDCYARNVMRASVTPGRYRLHAGERFHERVDRRAFGIPEGVEPWMLLEPVR